MSIEKHKTDTHTVYQFVSKVGGAEEDDIHTHDYHGQLVIFMLRTGQKYYRLPHPTTPKEAT